MLVQMSISANFSISIKKKKNKEIEDITKVSKTNQSNCKNGLNVKQIELSIDKYIVNE